MDTDTGLLILNTVFVAGIFWRMGGFQAGLDALKVRVTNIERKIENA